MNQSENLNQLFQKLEHYLQNRRDDKVVEYKDYQSLKDELKPVLNPKTGNWDQLWETVDQYLKYSVKTDHPQFFNQLWSGQSLPALIGEVISTAANTSMYTYEVSPVATILENQLLSELKKIVGFENGEAQFTTGGSNGNLVSVLLAREKIYPQSSQTGLAGKKPLAVFTSKESHYSWDKAINATGIGAENLYHIEADENGSMDVIDLETKIKKSIEEGKVPCLIGGTAGTTVRGAYDPFLEISNIAKKYNCWFHIDGAWGGSVVLSQKHKPLLKGLEKADSFSWDAHKMLGLPLMCSMLFVQESGWFDRVLNLGDTSYIFHGDDRPDLGPYSLQCGRKVDILKWWLEWQFYGKEGLEARVDNLVDLAKYAQTIIQNHPNLELQSEPWIGNVCFRYTDPSIKDLGAFNRLVRDKLHQSGSSFTNVAYIDKNLTIRLILSHFELEKTHIDTFFDNFIMTAKKCHD